MQWATFIHELSYPVLALEHSALVLAGLLTYFLLTKSRVSKKQQNTQSYLHTSVYHGRQKCK